MREVGAQLRQVRLERGEELDAGRPASAHQVDLSVRHRAGRPLAVPGRTYALGFLRSYADYLGFDGNDLIVQIKSSVGNLTDKPRLRIRTPLPESRLPKTPVLVLSLAAIAALYAGWSLFRRRRPQAPETVAEVPSSLRSLALDEASDAHGAPAPPRSTTRRQPPDATLAAGAERPAGPSGGRPSADGAPAPAVADAAAPRAAGAVERAGAPPAPAPSLRPRRARRRRAATRSAGPSPTPAPLGEPARPAAGDRPAPATRRQRSPTRRRARRRAGAASRRARRPSAAPRWPRR